MARRGEKERFRLGRRWGGGFVGHDDRGRLGRRLFVGSKILWRAFLGDGFFGIDRACRRKAMVRSVDLGGVPNLDQGKTSKIVRVG